MTNDLQTLQKRALPDRFVFIHSSFFRTDPASTTHQRWYGAATRSERTGMGLGISRRIGKLTLDGKTVHTKTDEDGAWEMLLPAMKAGGPYTITLEGQNRIVLKNVVFGEVWVCSGQSNMELTMARVRDNYADVVQQADMPDIRQFLVPDQFDFKKKTRTWKKDTGKVPLRIISPVFRPLLTFLPWSCMQNTRFP